MEFPKRSIEHVMQSASWKIFQQATPPQWIIREVTERDYGIDSYMEIVFPDGRVTGELCSIQLKGTSKIDWREDPISKEKKYRLSGIKRSIINYWMNLPVPVFIILSDFESNSAYFAPVKDQIRENYAEYLNKKRRYFSFEFVSSYELGTNRGTNLFLAFYYIEYWFNEISNYLRGLLIHWQQYYEFIKDHQELDCFLDVEVEDQVIMEHIYQSCKFISGFMRIEWNVITLTELYEADRQTWKEPSIYLHQKSLSRVLKELEPIFIEIIKRAKILVTQKESDYWKTKYRSLFDMCLNMNFGRLIKS
jgi:hypothetical protein